MAGVPLLAARAKTILERRRSYLTNGQGGGGKKDPTRKNVRKAGGVKCNIGRGNVRIGTETFVLFLVDDVVSRTG